MWINEIETMPTTRFLPGRGVTLAVRTWPVVEPSDRTPVVLLPATGETAESWDVVATALASSRPTYAVDLRGTVRATGRDATRSG